MLKVAPNDRPGELVAFVRGRNPTFEMIGWITVDWAKKAYPLTDPGDRGAPAHFVSPSKIVPFTSETHAVCAWYPMEIWRCIFCGKTDDRYPIPVVVAASNASR